MLLKFIHDPPGVIERLVNGLEPQSSQETVKQILKVIDELRPSSVTKVRKSKLWLCKSTIQLLLIPEAHCFLPVSASLCGIFEKGTHACKNWYSGHVLATSRRDDEITSREHSLYISSVSTVLWSRVGLFTEGYVFLGQLRLYSSNEARWTDVRWQLGQSL